MSISTELGTSMLLCRAGSLVCGLRVDCVVETMRPLAIEPLAQMPEFVLGLSIVRGRPLPVVDLARLVGERDDAPGSRFVIVRIDGRGVALLVSEVLGLRRLDATSLQELPPLLRGAGSDAVEAMGALDVQLLLVLEGSRIMPPAAWSSLHSKGAT